VFEEPAIKRSPLAEAVTKIAMASDGASPRTIVLITDAREVGLLDFECPRLPPDAAFLSVLRRQRVLAPGVLQGIAVEFAFMTIAPIPGRNCPVTIERQVRLGELWTVALKNAGASSVRMTSGVPVLAEIVPNPAKDGGTP
jgi:hypothetical protein